MIDKHEAKIIAIEVVEALKEDHGGFWMDPKTHYDCHIKFNGWVSFFEKCKEDCSKMGRWLFIVGGFGVLGYGIYIAAHI